VVALIAMNREVSRRLAKKAAGGQGVLVDVAARVDLR
jgi:hypothetical protein